MHFLIQDQKSVMLHIALRSFFVSASDVMNSHIASLFDVNCAMVVFISKKRNSQENNVNNHKM